MVVVPTTRVWIRRRSRMAIEPERLHARPADIERNTHPIAKRLRADHAALASLLVPTPTGEITTAIQNVVSGTHLR